jgi:hypothetical protein
MSLEPLLEFIATLIATFLGPWFAFRLARAYQERKDAIAERQARVQLTLSVLRDYEDHEFSKRRVTLAEFQRDWATRHVEILDIVFPAHGQMVSTFFSDAPDAPLRLTQHQNVNRYLGYLFMLSAYAESGLIDASLLKAFAPRYAAYRQLVNDLREAVLRAAAEECVEPPVWCAAIPKLERILELRPLGPAAPAAEG